MNKNKVKGWAFILAGFSPVIGGLIYVAFTSPKEAMVTLATLCGALCMAALIVGGLSVLEEECS